MQAAAVIFDNQYTFWVTSTQARPAPVAGATASIYAIRYNPDNNLNTMELLVSCETAADGSCTATASLAALSSYPSLVALVAPREGLEGAAPVIVQLTSSMPPSKPTALGVVVLDRALVRPGEKLHVTGAGFATLA